MGTATATETSASYPVTGYQVVSAYAGSTSVFLLPVGPSVGSAIQFSFASMYIGTGTPPDPYTYGDFQFAIVQSGTAYSVQITLLSTGNIWSPTNRAEVMTSFAAFLAYVEANYELAQTPILVPGSTYRIGQAIADVIPAPLLESIFYRYSFNPGYAAGTVPYVDIRPGMRLRVETQASQLVSAGSSLNGYISGGQSIFRVNSVAPNGGPRTIGFDPFLSNINSPSVTGNTSTQGVLSGGLVDLQALQQAAQLKGNPGRYVRLFYPNSVPGPTSGGSVSPGSNPTLVMASNLTDLNGITNNGLGQANYSTLFLGRAIAVPEIPVWISLQVGSQQPPFLEYVPIGTTVTNIVERFAPIPATIPGIPSVALKRVNSATGSILQVTFPSSPGAANLASVFDVPLIAGDFVFLIL